MTSLLTTTTPHYHDEDWDDGQRADNRKCPAKKELPLDDSPSPAKKALPSFDTLRSDEDSILSSNDPAQWALEEDRVLHAFAKQGELEEVIDNAAMDSGPIAEVEEWTELGNEEAAGNEPAHESTLIRYADLKTSAVKCLKDFAMQLRLSGTGTKRVLYDRIRDSGHPSITKLGNDEFALRRVVTKKQSWVILTPKTLQPIRGKNMATGAQQGFYGPTNKENAVGAT
jgi:hypothetical protein